MIRATSIYFTAIFMSFVSALEYSRSETGYPVGYSYDCPKYLRQSSIGLENLDRLYVSVMGENSRKITTYDYYHVGNLARHPDMNFEKRTVLYVAGYYELFYLATAKTIGQLYKERGYNVVILNTVQFTAGPYPLAASYVRSIGKHVAEMLANLTTHGLNPKRLDLLGPNIGAHTSGFIGKYYRKITGQNISSITALDAAGPCFRRLGPEARLDQTDADFVLSMTLNMDGFGIATPLGHVTFYVNGGEYQPADVWFLPCAMDCSHVKGYAYWASAIINPYTFVGMQCDSIQQARDGECYDRKPLVWNTMDLFTDRNKPGIYFLPTWHRYPYSLGKAGLKKEHDHVTKHLRVLNEADVKRAR